MLSLGAAPSGIEAGDPFGVAGRKAMWVQVQRLLAREPAIRDPAETDALRRYRVATRRLRSALRFFRDAYGARETRSLRNGLSDLADALGRVRDLDVRVEHLDAWSRERAEDQPADVEPLLLAWGRERNEAAAALVRELDSRGHRRLLERLIAFVETPSALGDAGRPTRPAGAGPGRVEHLAGLRERAGVRAGHPVGRPSDPARAARRCEAPPVRHRVPCARPRAAPRAAGGAAGRAPGSPRRAQRCRHDRGCDPGVAPRRPRHPVRGTASLGRRLPGRSENARRPAFDVAWVGRGDPIAGVTFARRLGRVVVVAPAG